MLLILGCIMDMAPLILICTPILFPVLVLKMGMDPTHFGIMLLLNLCIGLCTPPVGSALYVGSAIGKISIERASRGCIPFYFSMLVTLMLVTCLCLGNKDAKGLPTGRQAENRVHRAETKHLYLIKKGKSPGTLAFFIDPGKKLIYFTALILLTTAMISGGCLS